MIRRYPSLFLLCFVVSGVAAAELSRYPSWLFLLAAIVMFVLGVLGVSRYRTFAAVVFGLAFFCFSGFHYALEVYDTGPNHISRFARSDQMYHIFGRVSDWPELKSSRTEVKVALDSIISDRTYQVSGAIMLRVGDTTTALQRNDRVELFGRIYPVVSRSGTDGFDYGRYLHLRGIFGVVYLPSLLHVRSDHSGSHGLFRQVDQLRRSITGSFARNLTPASAAVASGFLIGETRNISPEIYSRFRDSGTLHLLAVSGSNVAIVLLFIAYILRPFSLRRGRRAIVLFGVIFLFAALSYGDSSVTRASIMASLVILAGLLERKIDLNNIIAATALVILLFDPAQLFDVGFQLSFVTAWGLIFIVPRLGRLFAPIHRRPVYRYAIFPLMISLVAQICSAPLVAYHFQRVPLVSVVANLAIVPLVSLAVIGILVLLVADLILPSLGLLVGSLLNVLMKSILWLLDIFGGDHVPVLQLSDWPVGWLLAIYALIFLIALAIRSRAARRAAIFASLIMANFALVSGIVSAFEVRHSRSVHLFGLPGGVGAVVRHFDSNEADLVITDIHRKEWEIDEVVVVPALRNLGIDRLHQIILMRADYGAIDDIVRLVATYQVETLFVAAFLENSARDLIDRRPDSGKAPSVKILVGGAPEPVLDGYCMSGSDLLLSFGSGRIRFVSGCQPDEEPPDSQQIPSAVVFGNRCSLPDDQIQLLFAAGYAQIVCARLDGFQSDSRIFDLSGLGNLTLFPTVSGITVCAE
ncbi:MAG: ComEC/Rec2 family competence protein [candidate division Zixibacteria bacterium]|nr:ComEC/Rec2 family competence protein [candidate division Zixibacteria bacterium]